MKITDRFGNELHDRDTIVISTQDGMQSGLIVKVMEGGESLDPKKPGMRQGYIMFAPHPFPIPAHPLTGKIVEVSKAISPQSQELVEKLASEIKP